MGLLIPEDIPLDRMPASERRVVRAFQSTLRDSWMIIPRLDLVNERRPFEVDVLLINDLQGIVAIEVKGGPLEVRKGEWYRQGQIVNPPPPRQAQDAAYELRNQLRRYSQLLERVHVQPAVALPDLRDFGDLADLLPPGVIAAQLLFAGDLTDANGQMEDRLWELMETNIHNRPLAEDQVEAVVGFLRPDLEFRWDPQARARYARVALHRITADQTRALATLDLNHRVVVSGPAGSGKTRLATAWSERALSRGERTLLTCFNVPMAEALQGAVPKHDLLTVGPVQRTLMALEGLPDLEVPDGAGNEWWSSAPFTHVLDNIEDVVVRFDTIVVDEAQDFAPRWLEVLECLLDDEGPGRILMVTDPDQGVYNRGYQLPNAGSDLVRAELTMNCRNTHQIANFLRQLGGAPAASGAPEGEPVKLARCSSSDDAVDEVGLLLEDLVVSSQIDPANILVLTGHTSLRDRIRDESPGGFACAAWEDRHGGDIVCETIHRMKGLERDAVILVTEDDDLDDHLLYVGMSRAISRLVVVGPPALTARLQALMPLNPATELDAGNFQRKVTSADGFLSRLESPPVRSGDKGGRPASLWKAGPAKKLNPR